MRKCDEFGWLVTIENYLIASLSDIITVLETHYPLTGGKLLISDKSGGKKIKRYIGKYDE